MTIKCHFGVFSKVDGNREVTIELRSRLVMRTLAEVSIKYSLTCVCAAIHSLPHCIISEYFLINNVPLQHHLLPDYRSLCTLVITQCCPLIYK